MTDAPELKPCPFCGGSNLDCGGDDHFTGYWCLDCQMRGPNHYDSRNGWNTRSDLSADRLAAAEKLAEEMQTLILRIGRSAFPQRIHEALAEWEASK